MLHEKQFIWDLYSSKLEYKTEVLDIFDRSITAYTRPGRMDDPAVSSFLKAEGFKPEYPNNKKFAVCLSHDVDYLFQPPSKRNLLKQLAYLKPQGLSDEVLRNFRRKIEPFYALENLLEIEKDLGIVSTFYFLSVEKDNLEDYNYSLSEISSYFSKITEAGSEIGLHGSKLAYNKLSHLKVEMNRLKQYEGNLTGYRNHYLKFEIPTSWQLLSQLGFKYATTFGSASSPGFRNGICFPFQPFDLQKNEWIDIYEIPLIAMDVSFFNYLKLDFEVAFTLFTKLVQKVKSHNGVFSFLWHNNYMEGEMKKFYTRCLKYLVEEESHFFTGQQLIDWWESQNYFNQQKQILEKIIP